MLPGRGKANTSAAVASSPLRSGAAHLASVAWRDAMAVRSIGRRQLPLGLVVALLSWVLAYAAAWGATSVDSGLLIALFAVVAAIMLTTAWVVSWMVIEYTYYDWQQDGRKASAYELISRCTLEITYQHDH